MLVIERARHIVRRAMDAGWSGPPFDPITLAELLKIPVIARDDVAEARTVPVGKDSVRIEFNPSRPPNRVRYSVAHEIAHTIFPDCAAHVRNRAAHHEMSGDEWQLEALCNIGAAEFLMPAGSLHELAPDGLHMDRLLELRSTYAVSTEAMLIRVARMSDSPCAMFCASRIDRGSRAGKYHLDYLIASPGWDEEINRGLILPGDSAASECIAIGLTAARVERWAGSEVDVQCVGIPAYPGRLDPRVVGVLTPRRSLGVGKPVREGPHLSYVRGDATKPRGAGIRVIAHIVNDATSNWGGAGFASALRRAFPEAQRDFQQFSSTARGRLALGQSHHTALAEDLEAFHMVAQHGYGPSAKPRIRYAALDSCLSELGAFAQSKNASVHVPRIGTGEAGGTWDVVRDMIIEHVCAKGIAVTVYDLPNRRITPAVQPAFEFRSRT